MLPVKSLVRSSLTHLLVDGDPGPGRGGDPGAVGEGPLGHDRGRLGGGAGEQAHLDKYRDDSISSFRPKLVYFDPKKMSNVFTFFFSQGGQTLKTKF